MRYAFGLSWRLAVRPKLTSMLQCSGRPTIVPLNFQFRRQGGHMRTMSTPSKAFPNVGFQTVPADQWTEEGNLPNYNAEKYYAVRIGEVLRARYQIVGKLGFGGGSTVWACRDLRENEMLVIKTCTTGTSIAPTPIPDESLESREKKLKGDENALFLKFVRKVQCWLPEDRSSAEGLYSDEFLNGYVRHEGHADGDDSAEDKPLT